MDWKKEIMGKKEDEYDYYEMIREFTQLFIDRMSGTDTPISSQEHEFRYLGNIGTSETFI